MSPRAVVAVPLYKAPGTLPEALESLLTQTYRDFALVLVDDGGDEETKAVVEPYLALDGRVSYHRNDERLGLTSNWRHAFELAVERHPGAEFFAWASDHDVWHPRWLEAMTRALDERPDAALAFPDAAVIEEGGSLRIRPPTRDTSDVSGAYAVLDRIIRGRLRASHMVYGLLRVDAVKRAGGFRDVLLADRLLVSEVGLRGPLVRVPEILWYRRLTGGFSLARQRRSCFPRGVPLYARLPWPLVHAAALARTRGPVVAVLYLGITWRAILERRLSRLRKRVQKRPRIASMLRLRGSQS